MNKIWYSLLILFLSSSVTINCQNDIFDEETTSPSAEKELQETAKQAFDFLVYDEKNLTCFLIGEDCSQNNREALGQIQNFLETSQISKFITIQQQKDKIDKTEEILRKYYKITTEEYFYLGRPFKDLIRNGYQESNYGDQEIKRLVKNFKGGYSRIISDKNILDYLTYLYYGIKPDVEHLKKMRNILNPAQKARKTKFEQIAWGVWGALKKAGAYGKKGLEWTGRQLGSLKKYLEKKYYDIEKLQKEPNSEEEQDLKKISFEAGSLFG